MVDHHQDGFSVPTSGGRINSSCMNMMERGGGGSWKPNAEVSPPACPRCGSSNTKFCYYNNYSLTQPRYFCKGCRRYWTKGGSLRNVPIGGGCRKSRRSHHNIIKPSSPPIRLPSTTPSPFGLISATPNSTSTTPATSSSDAPNIDLAVVYANFLNPKNKPQPPLDQNASCHDHHHEQREIIVTYQLPNDTNNINPGSSLEFLGVHNNLHLDLLPAPRHQQDGNYIVYHSGGLDSIRHHHHSFTNVKNNNDPSSNIINSNNNYVLPPLPDDEAMVWPSSISMADLIMLPTHQILDVDYTSPRSSSVVQPQGQNCQRLPNGNDDMSSLINIDDIFKS